MAPLSSIWSDLLKKKTSKVVRYNHPSEAQSSGGGAPPTPPNWFKVAASYQGVPDGTSRKVVKSMLVDAGAYVSQLAEKVSSLEQQLEHLQVDRDACNATMSSLHKDLSESRAALIAAQKQIRELQQCLLEHEEAAAIQHESLQMLKAEYTFASADKQRAQEKMAQLAAEAEEAAETKQVALRLMREELAAARAGKAEVQQHAEQLAQQLAAAQAELQAATQQVQELQQQLAVARAEAEAHARAYEDLQTKLFLAEESACKAQEEASDLSGRLSTAQHALEQSEQRTQDLTAQLTGLSSQLAQQHADMQCAEGSTLQVQDLLQQAKDEGMQLSEQLSTVLHQLAAQQDARLAAEQAVAGLKLELKVAKDQHTQQLHELQQLQLHCDEMRLARSAALCSAAMLEQQLSSKDAELARQQELAAALSAQVQQHSSMYEDIVNGNIDTMLDSMYSQAKAAAAVAHVAGARSPQHWRPLRSHARSWPSGKAPAAVPAAAGPVVLPAGAAAGATVEQPEQQPTGNETEPPAAGSSRASDHSTCTDHSSSGSESGTDASGLELLETDQVLQQAADKLQQSAAAVALTPADAVPAVPHAEDRSSSIRPTEGTAAEAACAEASNTPSHHLAPVIAAVTDVGSEQHSVSSSPKAAHETAAEQQLLQDPAKACTDSSVADTQSVADAPYKAPALSITIPSLGSSMQLVSIPKDSAQSAAQGNNSSSSSPKHSSGWASSPRALLANLRERMSRSPTARSPKAAGSSSARSSTASASLTDLTSPGRVPSPAPAAAAGPNLPVFKRLFGTVYGKPAPIAPSPFSTPAASRTPDTGSMLAAGQSAGNAGSVRASMERGPMSSTAGRFSSSCAAALRASAPVLSTGGVRVTMQRTLSTSGAGVSVAAVAASLTCSGAGASSCVAPSPAVSYSSFGGGISRSNSMGRASTVCRITGGSSGGAVNISTKKQAVSVEDEEHSTAEAPAGHAAAASTQPQGPSSLGGSKAAPGKVALPVYVSTTDKQFNTSAGGADKTQQQKQQKQDSSADSKAPAALPKLIIRTTTLQSEGMEQHRPQTPPASSLAPNIQQPALRSTRYTNSSVAFVSRIPKFSSSGGGSDRSSIMCVTHNSASSVGGSSGGGSSTLSERLRGKSRIPSYGGKPTTAHTAAGAAIAPAGTVKPSSTGGAGQTNTNDACGLMPPPMLSSLLVARAPSRIPSLTEVQTSAAGPGKTAPPAAAATGTFAATNSNSSSMQSAQQQTSIPSSASVIARAPAPAPLSPAARSGQVTIMSAAVAYGTTRALQASAARSNPSQGLCIRLAAQSAVTRGTAAAIAATVSLHSDSSPSQSDNQPCSPTGSTNSTGTSSKAARKTRALDLASPKGLTPLSPMGAGFRGAKASPKGQNPGAMISPRQPGRMSPLPA